MKRRALHAVLVILAVSGCLFAAPTALAAPEAAPAPGYTIALEDTRLTLYTGDVYSLQPPVVTFASGAVQTSPAIAYASSDLAVAQIDQAGVITALQEGSAVITVSAPEGVSATLRLTVKQGTAISGVLLKTDAYYAVYQEASGKTAYWTGKKYRTGALSIQPILTPKSTTQRALTFTSSDPTILQVDHRGVITLLRAPAEGKAASVTVTAASARRPELFAEAVITVVSDAAAFQTPCLFNGVWYEKAYAPKQFHVGDALLTVYYYDTVRGHAVYLDGNPHPDDVRRYMEELSAAHPTLVQNKSIDYIIVTSQRIASFFWEFSENGGDLIVGVASYDESSRAQSGIVLDGQHFEQGTMLHELAHMWDFSVSNLSDSKELRRLYQEEKVKLDVPLDWLLDPTEFLAYAIEDYFVRSEYFRSAAPKTTAFLDEVFGVMRQESCTPDDQAA